MEDMEKREAWRQRPLEGRRWIGHSWYGKK